MIEVWDQVQAAPVLREPALHEEGGRGLMTVNGVSSDWGFFRTTDGWKVVYAVFAL